MFYCKNFIGKNKNVFIKLCKKLSVLVIALGLFQTSVMASQCTKYVTHTLSVGMGSSTPTVFEYLHVNDALLASVSGDVICFKTGVYPKIIIKNIDGGLSNITLQAEQGSLVEITHSSYSGTGIYIENSKNIKISGFTLSKGLYGIYAKGSSDLTIENNSISEVGQEGIIIKSGVSLQPLNNFVVSNNVIADTGKGISQYGEGIYIGDGNNNFNEVLNNIVIENNHITNVSNEAIDVKINVNNVDIKSNTIIDTNLKFNGAITVATSDRYGDNANVSISSNTIRGVTNRMGYRAIGIAVGHGNASITNNFISETGTKFAGICLFTTFVNTNANTVSIGGNNIITNGITIVEKCGSGGTGANAPANVNYL
jgi:parallel beta-helix repeat protein